MRHLSCIALVGVFLAALTMPAAAANAGAEYSIIAEGAVSCGAWIQGREAATIIPMSAPSPVF